MEQPKLAWTWKTATDCDGEKIPEHEHWYAQLGEAFAQPHANNEDARHVAVLRYCTACDDLFLINTRDDEDGVVGLFEFQVGSEAHHNIVTKLATCEKLCFEYIENAFCRLFKTYRAGA